MDWPSSTTDIGVVERQNRHKGRQKIRRIARYDKSAGLVKEHREVKGRRPYILAGPILDYGADGPATLGKTTVSIDSTKKGKEKARWEWKYATAEKDDERYKYRAGTSSKWFPPTWKSRSAANQLAHVDEDQVSARAGPAAQAARKQELVAAVAEMEGMAGLDSGLLETLFDETPIQASLPQNDSGQGAHETVQLPVSVGNRLAYEIEGPVKNEDPQDIGNSSKLAILTFAGPRAELDPVYFLAFPSGEDRRNLNISPFRKARNSKGVKDLAFCPTAAPCMVFPSPILQISVSNTLAGRTNNRNTVYLAIRLDLFTYIISVDVVLDLPTFRSSTLRSRLFPLGMSPIQVREVDRIDLSRTRGARHMDVAMHPTKRRECVIIDDKGKLWRWRIVTNRTFANISTYGKISKLGRSSVKSNDSFYRIAWHEWERHMIVITAKTVEIVDTALGTTRRVIDFVNSSTRILDLYSNLDLDQATYAAILTTETIVWFDPAHDGRIMLSWKHYLPVSDGLRLKVLPAAKHMTVGVLSLKRGILTAFPVEEAGSILRISVQPYDLIATNPLEGDKALDDAVLYHLIRDTQSKWQFISVNSAGEVAAAEILGAGDLDYRASIPIEAQWSGAVRNLDPAPDNKEVGHVFGNLESGAIPTKERDFQRFWNSLVSRSQSRRDRPLNIDAMRRLVTDQDELYGMGMLTGLDVAALVNDDGEDEVETSTSYLRGYDIGGIERPQKLAEELSRFAKSKLARNIQQLPRYLHSGQAVADPFITIDTTLNGGRTRDQSYLRTALQRLAVDLQLSGIAIPTDERLSEIQPIQEDTEHQNFSAETATQTDMPELTCLVRKSAPRNRHEQHQEDPNKVATVRALLSQWTIGNDPSGYAWPGITSHVNGTRNLTELKEALPAPERVHPMRRVLFETSTQPHFNSEQREPLMSSQSQPVNEIASTQMLPGPFANRNPISFRRGGAKKRTIGF